MMRLAAALANAALAGVRHRTCPMVAGGRGIACILTAVLLGSLFSAPVQAQAPEPHASADHYPDTTATCTLAPTPDTLWSLAQCCAKDLTENPSCRYYSKANEFIVVKDNSKIKPDAYLIIPSIKVTGIEDKQVFSPPVVNFWQYAWQEAQYYLNKPAADTGLAINSVKGRDQNQLHIHISCVLPAVAQALASSESKIGSDPTTALTLPLGPHNNSYEVVKVNALTGSDSPFNLVAAIPHAKEHMGEQSIAVVGSETAGVYYVLHTYYVKGSNRGSAEELLNQTCTG